MTSWPALPYGGWADTFDTVHLVVQILGRVRVALSPKEPEWAHITLYVTARGLTTGPMPSNAGLFDIEADFLDHSVVIRTAAGDVERVALRARSPVHTAYEPEAATRFWRVLTVVEPVFAAYRAAYDGRVSRVQFFWGSADITVTRFSGKASESEQMSVGWWPGSASFPRPAFYAYAHPKPDGIEQAQLDVPGASWNAELGEFILHYDDARTSDAPDAVARQFLDAAYEACATRAGWDPRLVR